MSVEDGGTEMEAAVSNMPVTPIESQDQQPTSNDPPEHPQADEIRRQVEYYFSDANLPTDEHLLGKCGGAENLPVTIRHIHGFAKMRKYKPYRAVVSALKQSAFLDVVDDKYVKRKVPLLASMLEEDSDEDADMDVDGTSEKVKKPKVVFTKPVESDTPWLTKGMLKPTGFEEYWTDPPVTPEVFVEEKRIYDPETEFPVRIEIAIQRYKQKRKFHSNTSDAFNKWLKFGGIDHGQKQFSGKMDQETIEQYDAADLALVLATHHVGDKSDKRVWAVDFEGVAKSFLSSQFPNLCYGYGDKEVKLYVNVMRNFYNYILHHDVCPEYETDIFAARKVCDRAEKELMQVQELVEVLPGEFNVACSAVSGGHSSADYAVTRTWTDEAEERENAVLHPKRVSAVLQAGIGAYASDRTVHKTQDAFHAENPDQSRFCCEAEVRLGLEVVEIKAVDERAKEYYDHLVSDSGPVRALGKMRCHRWLPPSFAQDDLPKRKKSTGQQSEFEFWIENDILEHCFLGLKMEATVRTLDNGLQFLDNVHALYCSFFTLLPNELMKGWKEIKWLTSDRKVKSSETETEEVKGDNEW